MKKQVIGALVALSLAGCASPTNEQQGGVLGGVLGVALGSMIGDGSGKTAAMVLGGIFGAAVGSNIGAQLDERDRMLLAQTTQRSLEYGRSDETSRWRNPDTNHSGTVTPEPAFVNRGGKHCRNFTQTIYIDGQRELGNGQACRVNGEWMIQ